MRCRSLQRQSLTIWNSMIQTSTGNGFFSDSLDLYCSMVKSGVHGDHFTFPSVIKSCAKLKNIRDGIQVHAQIFLLGFERDVFVQTSLIDMYSKCFDLTHAHQLFDEITIKSLVSWNSIISAYSREYQVEKAFGMLRHLMNVNFSPSASTFVSLAYCCTGSSWCLNHGSLVHCMAIKLGLVYDLILSNSIMNLYITYNQVHAARTLFNSMVEKSSISWTILIGGYAKMGDSEEVLSLYSQMRKGNYSLDEITFLTILSACNQLRRFLVTASVHGSIIKYGYDHDEKIVNSLVNTYMLCGDVFSANIIFNLIENKTVISWTSMIDGYIRMGNVKKALDLFNILLMTSIRPNEVTIITLLSSCAHFGSLRIGEKLHSFIEINGFGSDLRIQTALIHMYCKCGDLKKAREMFDNVKFKDLAAWSSMVNGYASHGKGEEALILYEKMRTEVVPDAVVFTGVLSACSHSGLVEDGLRYFQSMQNDFGIKPSLQHYSCLMDLLGRAGKIDLALKFIKTIPFGLQSLALDPLLSSCRNHENTRFGEYVAEQLFELDPDKCGNYVLMANIYASLGKWRKSEGMRKIIDDRGLIKEPGRSWIEVEGSFHVFLSGDRFHGQSMEIYERIKDLNVKLREVV